jgi:hypothetical protein
VNLEREKHPEPKEEALEDVLVAMPGGHG